MFKSPVDDVGVTPGVLLELEDALLVVVEAIEDEVVSIPPLAFLP